MIYYVSENIISITVFYIFAVRNGLSAFCIIIFVCASELYLYSFALFDGFIKKAGLCNWYYIDKVNPKYTREKKTLKEFLKMNYLKIFLLLKSFKTKTIYLI